MAAERGDEDAADRGEKDTADVEASDPVLDGEVVEEDASRAGDARMVHAVEETVHSGPMPSKEWLEAVEPLAPGTTKELVADYLEQRKHEREMLRQAIQIDKENFRGFAKYQNRQLAAATTVTLVIASGGIVLIAMGDSIAGLVYLIAQVVLLAAVFLGRQVIQRGSDTPPTDPTQ